MYDSRLCIFLFFLKQLVLREMCLAIQCFDSFSRLGRMNLLSEAIQNLNGL